MMASYGRIIAISFAIFLVPAVGFSKGHNKSAGGGGAGGAIFSNSPIDPASPGDSVTSFETGDHIYAVLQAGKSWKEIYGDKKEIGLMVQIFVDGSRIIGSYVKLKSPAEMAKNYLLLDIAPKPSEMTAYSNPGIHFATFDGNKYGPQKFTDILSKLSPGKHTVKVNVFNYGATFGGGSFTIDGDDYKFYGELNSEIKESVLKHRKLPPAGQTDKAMEAKMRELAINKGWKNIQTLFIKDKDWWVESGVGRHMDAVVAAKAEDGSFYYSVVKYKQDQLVNTWGPLYISHTGVKIPMLEENLHSGTGSGGASSSGSPFILFRLILALSLIATGLALLSKPLTGLNEVTDRLLTKLTDMRALVGVVTLTIGALFFVKNLLTLSPIADLLPQAVAVVAGLYLGLSLLTKKGSAAASSKGKQTVEGEADEVVDKAAEPATSTVSKAQDMLTKNSDKVEMLAAYETPLGASAMALGLLHLIAGGVLFL